MAGIRTAGVNFGGIPIATPSLLPPTSVGGEVANDVVEPASAGLLIESLDIGWSGDRLKPQGKVRLKPAEN
ncbi:MAG: hypothetical protein ACI8P0_000638 [Planctomycetaceae bacterium]